ncbi:MAG: SufD family Fe-S cluster assembly protein [Rubrivivax sp.]
MNRARADALSARSRIAAGHWIARTAESFRHLPPPPGALWLGEATPASSPAPAPACDAPPLAGAGWTLHPVGRTPQARVDARWLDATDAGQRSELFAGVPAPGGEDAAPFAWAHRALCRQGLRLRIGDAAAGGRRETVWLQLRHQPRAEVEAPLLVIDLLPGVDCVLVEVHERSPAELAQACRRAIVQNLQVHLRLGRDASLRHLRIAAPAPGDHVAHHVQARLDRGAVYHQGLLASGCAYHLQRSAIALPEHEASARTAGVLLANGSALEQQIGVVHGAGRTASAVEALALGGGSARLVVNAHTAIEPGADEAQARQRLAGIPTGGQPKLVLRPHLEIQHDQVQAAHGATWGALPEDALFHAAQRGLDERTARALIIEGMARAALARCLDTPDLMETLGVDGLLARAVAQHLDARPGDAREACHG